MKIACISDLHGHLPQVPDCDVLVIAGDVCPATNHKLSFQQRWLDGPFRNWLEAQPAKHIVGTWGNHDWLGAKAPDIIAQLDLPWQCLVDQATRIARPDGSGLWFYGSPWQPVFLDWAFNLEEHELAEKYQKIRESECDVLISHGPPYGVCDQAYPHKESQHLGSHALHGIVREVQPKLLVCGHIHGGHGAGMLGKTQVVNASILDEGYRMTYLPTIVNVLPEPAEEKA